MLRRVGLNKIEIHERDVALNGLHVLRGTRQDGSLKFTDELKAAGSQDVNLRVVDEQVEIVVEFENRVINELKRVGHDADQATLQDAFELRCPPDGREASTLFVGHPSEVTEDLRGVVERGCVDRKVRCLMQISQRLSEIMANGQMDVLRARVLFRGLVRRRIIAKPPHRIPGIRRHLAQSVLYLGVHGDEVETLAFLVIESYPELGNLHSVDVERKRHSSTSKYTESLRR